MFLNGYLELRKIQYQKNINQTISSNHLSSNKSDKRAISPESSLCCTNKVAISPESWLCCTYKVAISSKSSLCCTDKVAISPESWLCCTNKVSKQNINIALQPKQSVDRKEKAILKAFKEVIRSEIVRLKSYEQANGPMIATREPHLHIYKKEENTPLHFQLFLSTEEYIVQKQLDKIKIIISKNKQIYC